MTQEVHATDCDQSYGLVNRLKLVLIQISIFSLLLIIVCLFKLKHLINHISNGFRRVSNSSLSFLLLLSCATLKLLYDSQTGDEHHILDYSVVDSNFNLNKVDDQRLMIGDDYQSLVFQNRENLNDDTIELNNDPYESPITIKTFANPSIFHKFHLPKKIKHKTHNDHKTHNNLQEVSPAINSFEALTSRSSHSSCSDTSNFIDDKDQQSPLQSGSIVTQEEPFHLSDLNSHHSKFKMVLNSTKTQKLISLYSKQLTDLKDKRHNVLRE